MKIQLPSFALPFVFSALSLLLPVLATAAAVNTEHVTAELVSETTSAQPGKQSWLGLKLVHEPHWHTYWINPGDSGLPTRFSWELPTGFKAGDIAWPAPKRFDLSGLFNYGYDGTVLLPVAIDVPSNAPVNSTVHVVLNAKWLICSDQCIPGNASVSLDLKISTQTPTPDAKNTSLFVAARAAQPHRINVLGQARVIANSDQVHIELKGNELRYNVVTDVFPVAAKLLSTTPPKLTRRDDQLMIDVPINDYFETTPANIDLVLVTGTASWQVTVPWIADHKPSSR